jgi:hypothetical protein
MGGHSHLLVRGPSFVYRPGPSHHPWGMTPPVRVHRVRTAAGAAISINSCASASGAVTMAWCPAFSEQAERDRR